VRQAQWEIFLVTFSGFQVFPNQAGSMTPETFRSVLFRLVLVPVVALAAVMAALLYQIHLLRDSAVWVDHTDVTISQTGELLSLFLDQETGLRGYLLTDKPEFLEPYNRAAARIPSALDRLQSLTADDVVEQHTVVELRQQYMHWSALATERLLSGRSRENLLPEAEESKRYMDQIRILARQMLNRGEQLRSARVEHTLALLHSTFLVLGAVGLLAATLIAWAALHQIQKLSFAYDRRLTDVQRQREWLNTTLRSIGDGVIACDSESRVVFLNQVAEQLIGWPVGEALHRPISEIFRIIDQRSGELIANPIDIVCRTGAAANLSTHTLLIRRGGAEIPVADSAAPIRDGEGNIVGSVLVFRDVTEQKHASEALRRAEKVAVAGKLAASIAHEINNPLEALTNLLYLASTSETLKETREFIDVGQEQLRRAAAIVAQTLEFHRGSPEMTPVAIPEMLESVISIWQDRLASRHIRVFRDFADTPTVLAYHSELRQVITNLIGNAYESMNSHGRLILRTRLDTSSPVHGPRVRITVGDTGSGIEPGARRRVFEAFFTTKATGTGLGLWVTKEIVLKHGGTIRIHSRRSSPSGTAVSIFLPLQPSGAGIAPGLQHAVHI
jgi:PAS domain S-box-containing protein